MDGTAVGFPDRVGRAVAPGTEGTCVGRALVGRWVLGRCVGRVVLGRGVGPRDGEPAGTVGAGVARVGRTVGLRDGRRVGLLLTTGAVVGVVASAFVVTDDDDDVDLDGDLDAVFADRCVGWLLPKNAVGWYVVVSTVG